MSKLMSKLIKSTKLEFAGLLSESKLFAEKETIRTAIPLINVAFSGDLEGGQRPGLTSIAGPSRHFKSSYALLAAAAFMKKHGEEAVLIFYDSEFGSPEAYFKSFGIPVDQVLHIPITNIEELKFDIMQKLDNKNPDGIKRTDKVFILVDSVGNLASVREAENAIAENSAADMTRAKELKSLWRLITPHLTMKNIAMIAIQHTYQEMKLYGKTIMSGGQGGMLSSDNVWIIGKSQEKDKLVDEKTGKKDSKESLVGYTFTINIEKSRYVKEKSKLEILVKFDGGISKYTGILDLAVLAGEVTKPKAGWYETIIDDGEILTVQGADATENEEFLGHVLKRETFKQWVRDTFQIVQGQMIAEDAEADLAEIEAEYEREMVAAQKAAKKAAKEAKKKNQEKNDADGYDLSEIEAG